MTGLFFLRELRRQAPVGLALIALGLLLVLSLALFVTVPPGYALVPVLMAALAPYLLAVAAVAPDVESGAEAFLARLPASRAGLLAARLGAAVTWTLAVLLSTLVFQLGAGESLLRPDLPLLAAMGLAAGFLASAVLRPTLLAFALGPLSLAPWWAWSRLTAELGGEFAHDLAPTLALALALPLGAAVVVYLRGRLHGPSLRPLGMALGLFAAALLLGGGGTTVAWAVARSRVMGEQMSQVVIPELGRTSAFALSHRVRWGQSLGFTFAEPERWELHRVDDEGHTRTRLPGSPYWAELSPDGTRVVCAEYGRVRVRDTAGLTDLVLVEQTALIWSPPAGVRYELLGDRAPVVWIEGVPWVSTTSSEWLELAPGGRRLMGRTGPERMDTLAASGTRVLLERVRDDTLWLLDLARPAEAPAAVERAPGSSAATLVAGGRVLVELIDGAPTPLLRWRALDGAAYEGTVVLGGLEPRSVIIRPYQWPLARRIRVAAHDRSGRLVCSWDRLSQEGRWEPVGGLQGHRLSGMPASKLESIPGWDGSEWRLLSDGRVLAWSEAGGWVERSHPGEAPWAGMPRSWVPLVATGNTLCGERGGVLMNGAWAPLWEGWGAR